MKRKLASLMVTILLLSVVLSGCGGKTPAGPEVSYWDEYKSTFSSGITTLNPFTLPGTSYYTFIANIIDGLVETDVYARFVPALAERWETNEDTTVWTFYLRKGQYWVDSTGNKTQWEITAQDFVDSLKYVADPANGAKNVSTILGVVKGLRAYYDDLADIDEGIDIGKTRDEVVAAFEETVGVKALDDYTLQYTLSGPTPYFLSYATLELFLPIEKEFMEQVGEDFGTNKESLLYCGSYYISHWERDKQIIMTKNEHYWDKDKITLKSLNFEAVADGISSVELFQRGQIATTSLTSEELASIKSTEWEDYVYLSDKTLTTYWFTFNFKSKNPEFQTAIQNLNFRKAIYAAIDRVTLSAIWEPENPEFFCRYTLLPEGCMFDENGRDYTDYPGLIEYKNGNPFQPEKAREYMEAAIAELCDAEGNIKGVVPGTKVDMLPIEEFTVDGKLPIDILYTSGSSETEMKKALLVKEMLTTYLGEENVNVILGFSRNSFTNEVWALGNWDLVDDSYGFRFGDPSANLNRITTDGSLNDSQYEVPEFDALVEKANRIYTINERYAAFAEAEKWMLDNAMIIPYMTGGGSYRMTRVVPYTTPQGYFGMAGYKFKGAKIQDKPVTKEQHAQLKAEYEEALRALSGN
ncbi:MAG TPA: peptide ABC transporter substrate-binding protein [Firmicutes bacterium]|nr:peptide ABC transporter substrate-binding protein [Candidatus Fermentithermobacillaceae bacterium]